MVTCLELEGYAVEAVVSTREAIDRLRTAESIPIVISDIYLDERTGIDVLRTARRTNPDCAGDPDDRARQHGNRDGGHRGRRVRVSGQAVRDGADDRHHQARRKIAGRGRGRRRSRRDRRSARYGNDRQLAAHDRDLQDAFAGRAHRRHGADRRRNRNRQRTDRAHDPSQQQARAAAVRAGGLRRHRAVAARKRAVRNAEGRLHRRRPRPHGRVRSRQQRHGVSGRNRRYRPGIPAKAAAIFAGARDPPAGFGARARKSTCA